MAGMNGYAVDDGKKIQDSRRAVEEILILSDDEIEIQDNGRRIEVITVSSDDEIGYDDSDTSDSSLSSIDIDHQKYEKKKTKPSPRKCYESESGNSSSSHRSCKRELSSLLPSYRPRKNHFSGESCTRPLHTRYRTYHYDEETKYPKPAVGVIRKKLTTPAKIQQMVELNVKKPCIGLNAVTEIQGLTGVLYYCSLCDKTCFSQSIIFHLRGENHMTQSARKFYPNYENIMKITPNLAKKRKLLKMLKELQIKYGIGKMAVEVEEFDFERPHMAYSVRRSSKAVQPIQRRDYQNIPSTSRGRGSEHSDIPFLELRNKESLPIRLGAELYCKVCQSHMRSQKMWEEHVNGKRHRTNLKKIPGDLPSKTKTVRIPNRKADLLNRLEIECPNEAIVGLDQIQETLIPKINIFTYMCFVCDSNPHANEIIEHLLSLKHRIKYLNQINFPSINIVDNMSEHAAYPIVDDMCRQVEAELGTGEPEVHALKSLLF